MLLKYIAFDALKNNDENSCQRLFHGRGHAYPGFEHINIDWLSPVILITLYKEVEASWLQGIGRQLHETVTECQSVQVQYRCRNKAPFEILQGQDIGETIVAENSLKYHIQLGKSQNTGLFLDMLNGRNWVRERANHKKILNLFSYTCPFSVTAIAGGAKQVVNIDNNKSVLSKGRENHRLNNQDTKRVKFEPVDIFKSWSRIKKYAPYDILICDPPSFQAGSVNIKRDYKKIISRIPQFMHQNSDIMLCLNSPDLPADFLFQQVEEHCPDCKFVETVSPPDVFKEAELGKGLKILIFHYASSVNSEHSALLVNR